MRVTSELWVKAYVRRCFGEGAHAFVARRGNAGAGAIYVKVNLLDGGAVVYGPAPAGLVDPFGGRLWTAALGEEPVPESEADDYLRRQARFDPDFWVVEVEDRSGRHFLDASVVS